MTRFAKRFSTALVVAAVVLVLPYLIAPMVIKAAINWELGQLDGYQGEVASVRLRPLLAGYDIGDMVVTKLSGNAPVPLASIPLIQVRVSRTAWQQGALRASILFDQAVVQSIHDPVAGDHQLGLEIDWYGLIAKLMPLPFDEATVVDGIAHAHNYDADPQVHLYLDELQIELRNLSNASNSDDRLFGQLTMSGVVMGDAKLQVDGTLQPSLGLPDMRVNLRMQPMDLRLVRPMLKAYAPLDVESGTFSVAGEITLTGGMLDGFIEPDMRDLDIFSWRGDVIEDGDSPLRALLEGLAGIGAELGENQRNDSLRTRIPVSGDYRDPNMGVLVMLRSLLTNVFVAPFQRDEEAGDSSADREPSGGPRSKGR